MPTRHRLAVSAIACLGLAARVHAAFAEPYSIGFELEDPSLQLPNADTKHCDQYRAELRNGIDAAGAHMIVGADLVQGTYCDLEIRSEPFDLAASASDIDAFFRLYARLYEDPTKYIADLVASNARIERTQIWPQITFSVPLGRIAGVLDAAPLVTGDEERALAAFKIATARVDHKSLGLSATRAEVDDVGELLAFYLAPAWPNVIPATRGNPMDQQKLSATVFRKFYTTKKAHTLFLKSVNRNGAVVNGVVDLYALARRGLAGNSTQLADLPAVLDAVLDATIDQLAAADTEVYSASTAAQLKDFTHRYVAYLEAQAFAVDRDGAGYNEAPFDDTGLPDVTVNTTRITITYKPAFQDLDGAAATTPVKPITGQVHSVYLEERRMGSLYWSPGTVAGLSKDPARAAVSKRVLDAGDPTKSTEAADVAFIVVDAVKVMIAHYKQVFGL